jgi:hypothetical protein
MGSSSREDEAVTVGLTWRRRSEGKQRGVTGEAPGGLKYAINGGFQFAR